MNLRKKLFTLSLCAITCFSTTNAFAASSTAGTSAVQSAVTSTSNTISIKSTSCPSKSSLYTNGKYYSVSGSATRSDLFTNYCFNGVSSISYSIKNNNSSKLTVKLCYYTTWGNVIYGTQKITVSANSTSTGTFTGLSSSKYYFIEFCSPSSFSGSVCGNE